MLLIIERCAVDIRVPTVEGEVNIKTWRDQPKERDKNEVRDMRKY